MHGSYANQKGTYNISDNSNYIQFQTNQNYGSSPNTIDSNQYLTSNPQPIVSESSIGQLNVNANETVSSIVNSNKLDVSCSGGVDEQSQQHSTAPTLPILSPHSPLLTDESTHHLNKNKLSVRYINNTTSVDYNFSQQRPQQTKQQSFVNDRSSTRIGNPFQTPADATTSSSKLLCYCEKSGFESNDSTTKKALANASVAKRLVPTRNAATSPNLDVRKLGSMTTLSPSPSLANEIVSKAKDLQCNKFKKEDDKICKVLLEKTNSLGESKPLKQLRTTRSLSPRPPIRHQHAIIASDSNDVDFKLSVSSKTIPNENHNQKISKKKNVTNLCRSEQSSPNIIDGAGIKFAYNKSTNYSTGCLGYVPSDPWLKLVDIGTISTTNQNSLPPKKSEKRLRPAKTLPENNEDPWVKRADVESVSKSPRHEKFRQCKSFSATKFDVDSGSVATPKGTLSNPCKFSGGYITNDMNGTYVVDGRKKLQSAPSSPHFLTTLENPFSSACYLNNQYTVDPFNNKTPTRSSSFSPARIKDCQNPFSDFNLPAQIPNSPPPMISVASESITDQQKIKSNVNNRTTNYSFLNVCNPQFLNTRHSFSSVPNQRQDDELQLNIRRLSDQMRRKGSNIVDALRGNMKTYSSDRNVSGNPNETNKLCTSTNETILDKQPPLNRADFSDYLEQFRCSEAKKAAAAEADQKDQTTLWNEKKVVEKTDAHPQMIINKSQQSTDFLLETTC